MSHLLKTWRIWQMGMEAAPWPVSGFYCRKFTTSNSLEPGPHFSSFSQLLSLKCNISQLFGSNVTVLQYGPFALSFFTKLFYIVHCCCTSLSRKRLGCSRYPTGWEGDMNTQVYEYNSFKWIPYVYSTVQKF